MLVGRDGESEKIRQLLSAAQDGRGGAVVVRGEAGVGKSALLEQAVADAEGFTVLRGVGVQVESELAYAALHLIFQPAFDRIDQLPPPQAAALKAAFALSHETVDERFRVSLGVLGLLSEVANDGPVLCLIDDAQWLDRASADALAFAARRLGDEGIALLIAIREHTESPLTALGLRELHVDSLGPADARRLIAQNLGGKVGANAVEWLLDNANGNPLALVELPASLTPQQLAGSNPIGSQLPPATSVEQVFLDRIASLPESTRELLLLAACEDTGNRPTVERAAAELGWDIRDLTAAESAELVRVDSEHVAFRHPLMRAAVYRGAAFADRERAHRVLAVAALAGKDIDRAAWHRAAATVGTDEDVAHELEDTATRARLRSGHAAAASALERAAALSPDNVTRGRRLVGAAGAAWAAGQTDRASVLLDHANQLVSEPRQRAEMNAIRGAIAWRCGSLADATTTLIGGAAEIAPVDPDKALQMLADAALAAWDSGVYEQMDEVGRIAQQLAPSDDPQHALLADVLRNALNLSLGQPEADLEAVLVRTREARTFDDPRLTIWSAITAELAGDHELEGALLARAAAFARASGAVDRLITVLESTTVEGFLSGAYSVTAEANEGLQLAAEAGLPNASNLLRASLSWIAGVQGREDECREGASRVGSDAVPRRHGIANSIAEWAVALLDLGMGRPEETAVRLTRLAESPPGVAHPFYVFASTTDLIEAHVRAGNTELAKASLERFSAQVREDGPAWTVALRSRCRGMLLAGDAAEREFKRALEVHELYVNRFDRARTQLVYGEFLRRERRRSDARDQLRAALAGFETLGTEPWAERARTELRATGESARKRDASSLTDLTPQELQIAKLVAEGNSNKDVAAHLFLSPRTVEYHLRKIFSKLGISSRAELIRDGVGAPA